MRDRLAACIAALDLSRVKLVAIAGRADAAAKFDLIDERRRLALALADLSRAATGPGCPFAGVAGEQFLIRFSEVRTAISWHQSTWSVVMIESGREDYRRSAQQVSGQIAAFVAWLRTELGIAS